MDNKRNLLYTSNVFNYIERLSDTNDYQDGLNNIRREYELIGESESEDYIIDMVNLWVETELDDLLGQFEGIQDVFVTGVLGLWNGKHTIVPTRVDNLKEAFWRCSRDMYDVEVYDNNGVIEINAYHHDGCNCFYIYQLNSKGLNSGDRADLTKQTYHKKIRLYQ